LSFRLCCDPDRRISQLFGAAQAGSSKVVATTCLLGPDLRLVEAFRSKDVAEQIRQLIVAAAPMVAPPSGPPIAGHAPVLTVPGVLDRRDCCELVEFGEGSADRARARLLGDQRRRAVDRVLEQTLFPGIRRVFGGELGSRTGYTLVRRDASETCVLEDDSDSEGDRAGRRFSVAVSVCDECEGGDLYFPEYGSVLYKPPAGTAIVSPTSIIRRFRPVTSGTCFTLTFFISGGPEVPRRP